MLPTVQACSRERKYGRPPTHALLAGPSMTGSSHTPPATADQGAASLDTCDRSRRGQCSYRDCVHCVLLELLYCTALHCTTLHCPVLSCLVLCLLTSPGTLRLCKNGHTVRPLPCISAHDVQSSPMACTGPIMPLCSGRPGKPAGSGNALICVMARGTVAATINSPQKRVIHSPKGNITAKKADLRRMHALLKYYGYVNRV